MFLVDAFDDWAMAHPQAQDETTPGGVIDSHRSLGAQNRMAQVNILCCSVTGPGVAGLSIGSRGSQGIRGSIAGLALPRLGLR